MKRLILLSALLFSSVHLMAQRNYFAETNDEKYNGIDAYEVEIPKGLKYAEFDNTELLKIPKVSATTLTTKDWKMRIYLPNIESNIINYTPKNSEKSYLKIYTPR